MGLNCFSLVDSATNISCIKMMVFCSSSCNVKNQSKLPSLVLWLALVQNSALGQKFFRPAACF